MTYTLLTENLNTIVSQLLDAADRQHIASCCEQVREPAENLEALGNRIALAFPAIKKSLPERACTNASLPIPSTDTAQSIEHWKTTETAQILLLACAIASHDQWSPQQIIDIAYRYGDDAERCSILKGLYWLDVSANMVLFAVDAGRTNSTGLLSSLACANPYPEHYYSEAQYNQLIMKALFMGLDISTITGLQSRTNHELTRMCGDYIAERLAARRSIPASIWLATNPADFSPEMLNIFIAHLCNNDPAQRFYTATCLTGHHKLQHPLVQAVTERLVVENDERIRNVLTRIG